MEEYYSVVYKYQRGLFYWIRKKDEVRALPNADIVAIFKEKEVYMAYTNASNFIENNKEKQLIPLSPKEISDLL